MDPLSITASIITLAGAAKGANLTCTLLYRAIFRAPEELRALKIELDLFAGYLEDVSRLPEATNASHLRLQQHAAEAHRTLHQILDVFRRVSNRRASVHKAYSGHTQFKRLTWAITAPKANRLKEKLRTLKEDMNAEITLVALTRLASLQISSEASQSSSSRAVQRLQIDVGQVLSTVQSSSLVQGDLLGYLNRLNTNAGLGSRHQQHASELAGMSSPQARIRAAMRATTPGLPFCEDAVDKNSCTSDDSEDTFHSCVSTLRLAVASASKSRMGLDSILERSSSFLPEQYTVDTTLKSNLFVAGRISTRNMDKYFFYFTQTSRLWHRVTLTVTGRGGLKDALASVVPPYRTSLVIDFPRNVEQWLSRYLQTLQLYESVTLLEHHVNTEHQICLADSSLSVSEDASEKETYDALKLVQSVESLGCPQYLESEIIVLSRDFFESYQVLVEGQLYLKKPIPFTRLGHFEGDGASMPSYMREIATLHHMRDTPGVVRFEGVILDDRRQQLKAYLFRWPGDRMIADVLMAGSKVPWPRRERWARRIVSTVADLHSNGFYTGYLRINTISLDDDDLPCLSLSSRGQSGGTNMHGNLSPELRKRLGRGDMCSVQPSVQTDLFQLGMLLWCVGNSIIWPVNRTFCRAANCERPFSMNCTAEHTNPIRLPPCDDPEVPGYYNDVIAKCRSSNPQDRTAASVLLQSFPSTEEFEGRRAAYTTVPQLAAGSLVQPIYCDRCGKAIAREVHYHCDECSGGDFDVCTSCHSQRHPLFRREPYDGVIYIC